MEAQELANRRVQKRGEVAMGLLMPPCCCQFSVASNITIDCHLLLGPLPLFNVVWVASTTHAAAAVADCCLSLLLLFLLLTIVVIFCVQLLTCTVNF